MRGTNPRTAGNPAQANTATNLRQLCVTKTGRSGAVSPGESPTVAAPAPILFPRMPAGWVKLGRWVLGKANRSAARGASVVGFAAAPPARCPLASSWSPSLASCRSNSPCAGANLVGRGGLAEGGGGAVGDGVSRRRVGRAGPSSGWVLGRSRGKGRAQPGRGHRKGRAGQMWVEWPAGQELDEGHEVRVAGCARKASRGGQRCSCAERRRPSRDGCRSGWTVRSAGSRTRRETRRETRRGGVAVAPGSSRRGTLEKRGEELAGKQRTLDEVVQGGAGSVQDGRPGQQVQVQVRRDGTTSRRHQPEGQPNTKNNNKTGRQKAQHQAEQGRQARKEKRHEQHEVRRGPPGPSLLFYSRPTSTSGLGPRGLRRRRFASAGRLGLAAGGPRMGARRGDGRPWIGWRVVRSGDRLKAGARRYGLDRRVSNGAPKIEIEAAADGCSRSSSAKEVRVVTRIGRAWSVARLDLDGWSSGILRGWQISERSLGHPIRSRPRAWCSGRPRLVTVGESSSCSPRRKSAPTSVVTRRVMILMPRWLTCPVGARGSSWPILTAR